VQLGHDDCRVLAAVVGAHLNKVSPRHTTGVEDGCAYRTRPTSSADRRTHLVAPGTAYDMQLSTDIRYRSRLASDSQRHGHRARRVLRAAHYAHRAQGRQADRRCADPSSDDIDV